MGLLRPVDLACPKVLLPKPGTGKLPPTVSEPRAPWDIRLTDKEMEARLAADACMVPPLPSTAVHCLH